MSGENIGKIAAAVVSMRKTLDAFGTQLKTALANAGSADQVATDLDTTITTMTQAFTDATTDLNK